MAIGVLVLGESGSGKSYAMHNFDEEEVKVLSVEKPILPFRKKLEVVRTPDETSIIKELKNTKKKVVVVDDFQYILGISMMKRSLEKGWDKFSEIQYDYFKVLDVLKELPDDMIVIFNSHVEVTDDGRTKIKTIGNALDKYITIEGMFMIVLGTMVSDGKYYFTTNTNGKNTVKSPEGMFPSYAIDNDLKYVVEKIKNYYYLDGAKSDEEIKTDDEAVKTEVEPEGEKKKTRRRKDRTPKKPTEPTPEDGFMEIDPEQLKDLPFYFEEDEAETTVETPKKETEEATPAPRRRRQRKGDK